MDYFNMLPPLFYAIIDIIDSIHDINQYFNYQK